MTREDIIRMARESGWKDLREFDSEMHDDIFMGKAADLERFATLVRADEREIFCAVLRQLHDSYSLQSDPTGIRARGQA